MDDVSAACRLRLGCCQENGQQQQDPLQQRLGQPEVAQRYRLVAGNSMNGILATPPKFKSHRTERNGNSNAMTNEDFRAVDLRDLPSHRSKILLGDKDQRLAWQDQFLHQPPDEL